MSRRLTALLLMFGGCFQPDLTKVTVLCPSESPSCPAGMVCSGGVCTTPPQADAAVPIDLGIVDGPGGDSSSSTPGCKGQGAVYLGPSATGCPGTFQAGGADTLCASGWTACTSSAGVDQATCVSAGSFFAAEVPAFWIGTVSMETCGGAAGNQLLYGCGSAGRSGTAKCGGLPRVMDMMGVWSTTNGTLAGAANSDPKQGVLCCKRGLTG